MIELKQYRDRWLAETVDQHIGFYPREFFCLDNFSSFNVFYKGDLYATLEHAYQAAKFFDTSPRIAAHIRQAYSAHEAKKIAHLNNRKKDPLFDGYKVELMEELLRLKAAQNTHVKNKLLLTEDYTIIEDSPSDTFWGIGKDRDGQNMLGKLWMKIRKDLKIQEEEFKKAEEIAESAHKGQTDKLGADYILHPKQVCEYCSSPRAKIAALLHDVVEDSDTTLDDLRAAGIKEDVVAAVDCLTKRKGEAVDEYLNRVASNDIAAEVKLADMRHNADILRWPFSRMDEAERNSAKYLERTRRLTDILEEKFQEKLYNACSKDTCYPDVADRWSEENRFWGHCALVAVAVYEKYGGCIVKSFIKEEGLTHYFNLTPGDDGLRDFTLGQYGCKPVPQITGLAAKEEILHRSDTLKRYKKFKARLEKAEKA